MAAKRTNLQDAQQTHRAISGARFGGAFGDEGGELGRALHLGGWDGPGPKEGVSLRIQTTDGEQKLQFGGAES